MKSTLISTLKRLRQFRRRLRSFVTHWGRLNTFLNFCERSQPGLEGSVNPLELTLLRELVIAAGAFEGPLVEVGTLFGFTTQAMAGWKQPGKEFITIDDYSWNPVGLLPQAHRDFTRRSLHYLTEHCQTTLFEGLSTDFYAGYKGPVPSMIFIDASHEYEHLLADIAWAKKAGVPLISGHDYSRFWPGVIRAVDESFGAESVETRGTLWAWKRPT